MRIWTAPASELTYEDVEAFVALKVRENEMVEYKSHWPRQAIRKWLCAFANYNGGLIVLGVECDADETPTRICGISTDQANPDYVDGESFQVAPPLIGLVQSKALTLRNDPTRAVLVIRVQSGSADVPYSADGIVYIRTDGSARPAIDTESKRVGVARPDQIVSMIRQRLKGEDLRSAIVLEIQERMERLGYRESTPHCKLVISPDIIRSVKGVHSLQEFEEIALARAPIVNSHNQFTPSGFNSFMPMRLVNGLILSHDQFSERFEIQRNGVAYIARNGDQLMELNPPRGFQNGFSGFRFAITLARYFAYMARVYRELSLFSRLRVEVVLYGTKDREAFVVTHSHRSPKIEVDFLTADSVVSSVDFISNPLDCLESILVEALYPTHIDVAEVMQRVYSELTVQAANGRAPLFNSGKWTEHWPRVCLKQPAP